MTKAHHVHVREPNSPETEALLRKIPRCPGTCFFIDIINSTDIKYQTALWQWGKQINDTFNFISILNDFPGNIVKGIGDELMLFISDEELRSKESCNSYLALLEEIVATIDNIKNYPIPDVFLGCKVGIHHCTEVYNISFFKGVNDYYGRDIDLSARLMSKSKAHRIVFSESFFLKVKKDAETQGARSDQTVLKEVSEKYIEDFKGVPNPTEYRIIQR